MQQEKSVTIITTNNTDTEYQKKLKTTISPSANKETCKQTDVKICSCGIGCERRTLKKCDQESMGSTLAATAAQDSTASNNLTSCRVEAGDYW